MPELTEKMKLELEQKLNEELGLESADNIEKNTEVNVEGQEVYVKLIYIMYEKIGTKEEVMPALLEGEGEAGCKYMKN